MTPAAVPAATAAIGAAGAAALHARQAEAHPQEQFDREWQLLLEEYRRDGRQITPEGAQRFTEFVNDLHHHVDDFTEVIPAIYDLTVGNPMMGEFITVRQVPAGDPQESCILGNIRNRRNFPVMTPEREQRMYEAAMRFIAAAGDTDSCMTLVSGHPDRRYLTHSVQEVLIRAYLLDRCGVTAPTAPTGRGHDLPGRACSNNIDDDGDQYTDMQDDGCESYLDDCEGPGTEPCHGVAEEAEEEQEAVAETTTTPAEPEQPAEQPSAEPAAPRPWRPSPHGGGIGLRGGALAAFSNDRRDDWYMGRAEIYGLRHTEHGLLDLVFVYDLENMDFTFDDGAMASVSHAAESIARYDSRRFTLVFTGGWRGLDSSSGYSDTYEDEFSSTTDRDVLVDEETGARTVIGDSTTDETTSGTSSGDSSTPLNSSWFTTADTRFRLVNDIVMRLGLGYFGERSISDDHSEDHTTTRSHTIYETVPGQIPSVFVERTEDLATDSITDSRSESLLNTIIGRFGLGGALPRTRFIRLDGDLSVSHSWLRGETRTVINGSNSGLGGTELTLLDGAGDPAPIAPYSDPILSPPALPLDTEVTTIFPSTGISIQRTFRGRHIRFDGMFGMPFNIEQRLEQELVYEGEELVDENYEPVVEVTTPEWWVASYGNVTIIDENVTGAVGYLLDGHSLTLTGLVTSAGSRESIDASPWAQHLIEHYNSELSVTPDSLADAQLAARRRYMITGLPGWTVMPSFRISDDPDSRESTDLLYGGSLIASFLHQGSRGGRIGVMFDGSIEGDPRTNDVRYDGGLYLIAGRGGPGRRSFSFVGGPFVVGDTELAIPPVVGGAMYFLWQPDTLWGQYRHTASEDGQASEDEPGERRQEEEPAGRPGHEGPAEMAQVAYRME
ncbi:hypothetical protein KY362_05000 [Candidatus Woesearchaeota archaeon]|nr:hypothetical protein [Candidatus Woesearchaeota archaeon]